MLVEYSALRDEILKREDMRQQMLTFAVLSAGTIMTLSMQEGFQTVWPLLMYPILATLLALAWMRSDLQIGEIGAYIRDYIESELSGLRWESHLGKEHKGTRLRSVEANGIGVFLVSQTLAVLLAVIMFNSGQEQSISVQLLLISVAVDAIAMVLTIVFLRSRTIKFYMSTEGKKMGGIAVFILTAVLLVGGTISLILSLGDPIGIGQSLGFEGHPTEIVWTAAGLIAAAAGLVLLILSPTPSASSPDSANTGG